MKRLLLGAVALAGAVSVVPSSATALQFGQGAFSATLTYGGAGIPVSGCQVTTFDISARAVVAFVNGDNAFRGPVTMEGNGHSGRDDWGPWDPCERVDFGFGTMTLSVFGTDPSGSTIHCDDLYGGWARTNSHTFHTGLDGMCSVNGVPAEASLQLHGAWAATHPVGAGVTSNITSITVAGYAIQTYGPCNDEDVVSSVLCTPPGDYLPDPPESDS